MATTDETTSPVWRLLQRTLAGQAWSWEEHRAKYTQCCSDLGQEEVGEDDGTSSRKRIAVSLLADNLVRTVYVDSEDLWLYHFPLALFMIHRAAQIRREGKQRRLIVGVAGCAAAGKSTWCKIMEKILSSLGERTVIIGQDAYHFSNETLEQRGTRSQKGQPHTFDVASLVSDITTLQHATNTVLLPIYDRALHNPVPAALPVPGDATLLFLEGLFVLLPTAPWQELAHSVDFSVFLNMPMEASRQLAVARKSKTNKISEEAALAHFEKVDLPNWSLIDMSKDSAHLQLDLDGSFHVTDALVRI